MIYLRVKCAHLSATILEDIDIRVKAIKSMLPNLADPCDKVDLALRSKIWSDKKVKEESHHALMSTGKVEKLTNNEKNIMTLI